MRYKVDFTAPIRGHIVGDEAIQYDRNAIGVFQSTSNDKSEQ